MAEEKKQSKGERRYSHPAKIEPKGKGGEMGEKGGDTGGSAGEMPEAKKKAESSAGSPKPQAENGPDAAPEGNVTSGTDGIAVVHERHAAERAEMYGRHEKEVHQMYGRQEKDHKSMRDRHHDELKKMSATEGGLAEK